MWKDASTPGTPDAPKAAMHEHDTGLSSAGGMLRRRFLTSSAAGIDASNMIVMPGFVNTHRHIWPGTRMGRDSPGH
jgi:cytosine/adenosine deaminase-related metal-dependent hydrolase